MGAFLTWRLIHAVFVVWGVVPPLVGLVTDSGVWQKAVAGAVAAVYSAATVRRADHRVRAAGREIFEW